MQRRNSLSNLESILPTASSTAASDGDSIEPRLRPHSTTTPYSRSSGVTRSFDADIDFISSPGIRLLPDPTHPHLDVEFDHDSSDDELCESVAGVFSDDDEETGRLICTRGALFDHLPSDDTHFMANSRKLTSRHSSRRSSTSSTSSDRVMQDARERTVLVLDGENAGKRDAHSPREQRSPRLFKEDTATPATPLAPFNFAALLNASHSSRPDDQMASDSPFDKDTTLCYPSSSLHDDDERDLRQVPGADTQRGELPAISEEDARDDEQELRRPRSHSSSYCSSPVASSCHPDGPFHDFRSRRISDRQDEFEQVVLRRDSLARAVRNGDNGNGVSPRCHSQFVPTSSSGTALEKTLSSSTPSVHSLGEHGAEPTTPYTNVTFDLPQENCTDGNVTTMTESLVEETAPRKHSSPSWAQHLPIAYGRHQVIAPGQRPTRSTSSVADSTAKPPEVKIRSDKQKRERGIFSMLSMRNKDKPKDEKQRNTSSVSLVSNTSTASSDLPKRSASTASTTVDGLPDVLAKALGEEQRNGAVGGMQSPMDDEIPEFYTPQLIKPKWEDLDLWSEEEHAWSLKYGSSTKLSKADKKKQDIIHDIYITEKHHCQVIVILQQVYQAGLRAEGILASESELNELIPSVLDGLLDFHLNVYRRIRARKMLAPVVDTISDIISSEFEISLSSRAAIDAYISFCDMKDAACRAFEKHFHDNPRFRHFIERFEADAEFKKHSFKSCLLLITQRLTKYPLMLDLLLKQESIEHRDSTARAGTAVKAFAMRVDNGLSRLQIHRRWDYIQKHFNRHSRGTLHSTSFTYEDLTSFESSRKVLCIGTVLWQNVARKPEKTLMVLFDDIICFLVDRNGQYYFFSQDKHESVIALKKMIVRDKERANSMLLIVTDFNPDMYEIMFANKSEMKQWRRALDNAQSNAVPVRRIVRSEGAGELLRGTSAYGECGGSTTESDERIYESRFDAWLVALGELFAKRSRAETALEEYVNGRLQWFDEVRRHMRAIPVRGRHDVPDRIKALVKEKFMQLRATRRAGLNRFISTAELSRDDDLPSIFDDVYDARDDADMASGSSDQEDDGDDGNRKIQPRRIRTFHGTGDCTHGNNGSFRRHTTVPKLHAIGGTLEKDEYDESALDEARNQLPIDMNLRSRRAATQLIKENVHLRTENNRLKADVALLELHVASLKTRRVIAASSPTDTLEALRKKQQEVQEEGRLLRARHEKRERELKMESEELERRQREFAAHEAELEEKWNIYSQRMNNMLALDEGKASRASLTTAINADRNLSASNFRAGSLINTVNDPRSSAPPSSPQRNGGLQAIHPLGKSSSSSEFPKHLADKTEKKKSKK